MAPRSAPNPVIPGFSPDPSVCRVGGSYYLVTSTFEYFPALTLYRSSNLTDWTLVGSVLDRPDQVDLSGVPDSGGLYAATIRHHEGTWWVVGSIVGSPVRSGSFVVTAQDPEGPWGQPVFVDEAHGIDPSLLFDEDRVWWVANELLPGTEASCVIWLRELDLASMRLVGPEHTIWEGASRGARWVEAPHLYRVDDWYYLVAAEGGTELNHAVVAARSRDVKGPYESCPANPVLTHRHLGPDADITAIGHADLVEAPDGTWWAVCLGTRRVQGHHVLGRETFLVPMAWEDGWPVLSPGVSRVMPEVRGPDAAGERVLSCGPYDFRGRREPGAEWLSVRGRSACRPTRRGLVVKGFLGLRLRHLVTDLVMVVRPQRGGTAPAGLLLRQSERHQVRLQLRRGRRGWHAEAVRRVDGRDELLAEAQLPRELGSVVLTGRVRGLELVLMVERKGKQVLVCATDARPLSTETAGGFVGTVAGPFADDGGGLLVERVELRADPGVGEVG